MVQGVSKESSGVVKLASLSEDRKVNHFIYQDDVIRLRSLHLGAAEENLTGVLSMWKSAMLFSKPKDGWKKNG